MVAHSRTSWETGEIKMTRCPSDCRICHIQKQRRRRQHRKLRIRATTTPATRMAEEATKQQKKKSFDELVPIAYQGFKEVFAKESFDSLPDRKKWDHAVDLIPNAELFNSKLYPMSPNEQAELDQFLKENLESGRIRPSKSPMASPVFFVKKKMELFVLYKIIGNLTRSRSRILILCPSFPTCSVELLNLALSTSLNLMYDGVTIIFESKKVTNGKQLFEPIVAFSNPW